MQTSKFLLAAIGTALLWGCNRDPDPDHQDNITQNAEAPAVIDKKIDCALAGEKEFLHNCETEKALLNGAQILTIHHPDGGFRRFTILTNGHGLAPTDGFDKTKIIILDDGHIELLSGNDRYHLPAEIKNNLPAEGTKSQSGAKQP